MSKRSTHSILAALAIGLWACEKEEPKAPPPPPSAPAAAATKAPEPPAFTAPDSGSSASAPEPAPAPEVKAPAPTTPESKPVAKAPAASPKKTESVKPAPAPEPASTPSTSSVAPVPDGAWVLQVGIHKTEEAAQAMAAKLKGKGFPAYVLNVATGGTGLSGSYYRVRVGAFATRDDALRYGENVLKPAGLKDFWADKKSNEARAREAQLPSP